MDRQTTRRALLTTAVGGGVAGGLFSPANSILEQFAPLSGSVWESARLDQQSVIDSPYGPAEVRSDEWGVPQITSDTEDALYYAVGYTQGVDRLFQMDLQRRLMRGELSEIVGEETVESDTFHRQMMFLESAEATVEHLQGTEVASLCEAFVDGINDAIEQETLPVEFQLLEYEPEPWTFVDSILVERLISWGLTGNFRPLRKALVRDAFGEAMAEELFPYRLDVDSPIIRDHHDAGPFGTGETVANTADTTVDTDLVDWLLQFEPPRGLGSNSWIISDELTAGDAPLVSNDPHLELQAPPVWYEMHVDGPLHRVRGVTFPGVPFVIIGENDHGAWGFTNAGADVIDFYTYETDADGRTYQYGDEEREFDIETQEIPVADAENRQIEVKRSVHGPVIEESEQEVGVAWIGHAATELVQSVYDLTHSGGIQEAREAMRKFEVPTQNFVYGDRDGNTLYQMTGRIPLRRIDGELVRGNQVFDGSNREGEWAGFEPFTRPPAWEIETHEGFVPFSENPHVLNPTYLATANQRIVSDDQLGYYLATAYAPPYRGDRLYELLDEHVESGEPFDLSSIREIGRDTYDGRAAAIVEPLVEAARTAEEPALTDAAELLESWDYRMEAGSTAALVFEQFMESYREEILADAFEEAGLDAAYYPYDGTVEQLPPDSDWFEPSGRTIVMQDALRTALEEIQAEGQDVYGDFAHTGVIQHPLGLDFLSYPVHRRGGSGDTLWNFNPGGPWGGSWEMRVDLAGDVVATLQGGNSGRYFSPHYDDQIECWANNEYRTLSRSIEGELRFDFREDGQ